MHIRLVCENVCARVVECFKVAYFSGKEIVRLYRRSRLIYVRPIQAAAYFHSYKWPPNNSNIAGLKIISLSIFFFSYSIPWVEALCYYAPLVLSN